MKSKNNIGEDTVLIILDEKIDLLKSEIAENKLYLELCFISLLVVIFGYFKTLQGQLSLVNFTTLGIVMSLIAIGLYIGIVYFFFSLIRINSNNRKMIKEKIDRLVKK